MSMMLSNRPMIKKMLEILKQIGQEVTKYICLGKDRFGKRLFRIHVPVVSKYISIPCVFL